METLNIILITLVSFICVLFVSAILDAMFFSEPKKEEDIMLVVMKLILEITIICIVTYLIILNIDDLTKLLNVNDKNKVLIPLVIVWILSINYYFKNKIFKKIDLIYKKMFGKLIYDYPVNSNHKSGSGSTSNNSTNQNNIDSNNKNKIYSKYDITGLNEMNNSDIFKKHHNLSSYIDFFDIKKYYPQLFEESNSDIVSGKYRYVELNNLKNDYNNKL